MKIGLYFGSFNPVHIGHLVIANHIVNFTNLQQVWFIVSPQNPFKPFAELLNENHRLHFIQSAIDGENNLKVSDVEFRLPKPSYTINTLNYLKENFSQHEFSIIMGSDSFNDITKWKNYEIILKNYPIFIYQRCGFEIENFPGSALILLDAPLLEISSTHVRNLLKSDKSARYLLPDKVYDEIKKNSYYK